MITAVDHVQLAAPPGSEEAAPAPVVGGFSSCPCLSAAAPGHPIGDLDIEPREE
ncbi:hypothetical protein [Streptomyces viridochromogenes]|uniref:hypothetical protein n=1 Tax=Streptomyces viridochromogenes TaxID=1938 RepID=UPI000A78281A|nr:hypothetical protein [Streptomyces viridochromogenes]